MAPARGPGVAARQRPESSFPFHLFTPSPCEGHPPHDRANSRKIPPRKLTVGPPLPLSLSPPFLPPSFAHPGIASSAWQSSIEGCYLLSTVTYGMLLSIDPARGPNYIIALAQKSPKVPKSHPKLPESLQKPPEIIPKVSNARGVTTQNRFALREICISRTFKK
jgi:hypothetical protein